MNNALHDLKIKVANINIRLIVLTELKQLETHSMKIQRMPNIRIHVFKHSSSFQRQDFYFENNIVEPGWSIRSCVQAQCLCVPSSLTGLTYFQF